MTTSYKRLTDQLIKYWEKIKGDSEDIPTEYEFDISEISSIIDDCFLIRVSADGGYKYDYMGKNLIDAYGEDFSSEEIDILISPNTKEVAERFKEVTRSKKPLYDEGEFRNSKDLLIKYRQLILPLGDKGGVSHVFGGMRWTVS